MSFRALPFYYGYWFVRLKRWFAEDGSGVKERRAKLVYFGFPASQIIKLPEQRIRFSGSSVGSRQGWVDEAQLGVVVPDPEMLEVQYNLLGKNEAGRPVPKYGVFVEITQYGSSGEVEGYQYLPAKQVYESRDLLTLPLKQYKYFEAGLNSIYNAGISSSTWKWPGDQLMSQFLSGEGVYYIDSETLTQEAFLVGKGPIALHPLQVVSQGATIFITANGSSALSSVLVAAQGTHAAPVFTATMSATLTSLNATSTASQT